MSGAAAAIYLLDMKGRVLIWRDYRGDVPASLAERFFAKLMEGEVRLAHMDPHHQPSPFMADVQDDNVHWFSALVQVARIRETILIRELSLIRADLDTTALNASSTQCATNTSFLKICVQAMPGLLPVV